MLTHWLFVAVMINANGSINQASMFADNEFRCYSRVAIYREGPKFPEEAMRFAICIAPQMPSGLAEAPVPSR